MSIWLRHIRAAAVAAVGLVLSAAVALGAEFKVGDLIEVAYLGEWRKATVVQTNQRGEVLAEYEFAGRANRKVFSPTDIRFQYEGSALAKGRMWSDTSGKFRIKAAVIAIGDTEVTLRKPDMSELKVPLASLSAGDQKFVESLIAKGGPTTTVAPEPPPTEQFQDPVSAGWVTIASAGADAITRVALQPDPIPDYMRLKQGGTAFPLEEFFDRLGAVLPIGGPDAWVLAAVESGHPDKSKALPTRVLWVSLAKQKVAGRHLLPLNEIVLDYHAGSRRLLTYNKETMAGDPWGKSVLTLWELTPTAREIKPIVRWNANSDDRHTAPWARVVDADTVVQRWKKQEYVGWDIPGRRVKWRVSQESFFAPQAVTSGGRKYLVLPEDERVRVLDSATGRVASVIPVSGGCASVSVSEDGYQLAVLGQSTLTVWDLTSADSQPVKFQAQTIGSPFSTTMAWIGGERVMVEGFATSQILFSLKHNMSLWNYKFDMDAVREDSSGRRVREIIDQHLVYAATVRSGSERGLAVGAVKLPGPKVDEADAAFDPESLVIIKPGEAVRLDVKAGENDARVRAALTAKIQANGWVLSDSAPNVMTAEMGQAETRTVTYHMRGLGGSSGEQSVTVAPFYSTLKLMVGDKQAWYGGTSTGPPPVIFLREGQTAQGEVDKWQHPNVAFFDTVSIPDRIMDPAKRSGLGSTQVTNRGLVAE